MRMEYTTLGRTELKVSVAGLGCGGHAPAPISVGPLPAGRLSKWGL